MQKLEELEKSISKLSDNEYAEFRQWFWEHENERWDAQVEKDIIDNKLANLANEALEDYKKGKFKSL
jgi:hypothetical protein